MTDELITRAEAALEGVTPGPWEVRNWAEDPDGDEWSVDGGDNYCYPITWALGNGANARFIAASRQLVPDLIAALRAANARADAAEAKLAEAVEQNTRLQTAIIASAKIGQIIGFLGDDEGRIEAFREACGPELLSKARATLAKIGGEG